MDDGCLAFSDAMERERVEPTFHMSFGAHKSTLRRSWDVPHVQVLNAGEVAASHKALVVMGTRDHSCTSAASAEE